MIQNGDDVTFGQPYVKDISVDAEIIESGKREKDIVLSLNVKQGTN